MGSGISFDQPFRLGRTYLEAVPEDFFRGTAGFEHAFGAVIKTAGVSAVLLFENVGGNTVIIVMASMFLRSFLASLIDFLVSLDVVFVLRINLK